MDINKLRISLKVLIEESKQTGKVCGFGLEVRPDGQPVQLVLIRLDEGFYNPDRTGFISVLVVHPDGLMEA